MNHTTFSQKVSFIETDLTENSLKRSGYHRIVFGLLLIATTVCSAFTASETVAAETDEIAAIRRLDELNGGLLGSQHLVFVGKMTDEQRDNYVVPEGSKLLRINPRTGLGFNGTDLPYYLLVRNVDSTESKLLDDAKDGKWDEFNLFSASIIAEGNVRPESLKNYQVRFEAIVADLVDELRKSPEVFQGEDLTKTVFTYLHEKVLTGKYDIDCSNPREVLTSGNYNCVSATIMFNAIAEQVGLRVCGLEMPGHALSRVMVAEGYIDLETTCAKWFLLADAQARRSATLQVVARPVAKTSLRRTVDENGIASVDSRNEAGILDQIGPDQIAGLTDISKELREVSSVQLVAAVYYNNGVDLINSARYAEALCENAKALQLDADNETVWKHIVAPINNWAIEYAKQKRYNVAAKLLDEGRAIDPGYENFKANQLHVYFHWIKALAEAGRYKDAETVYTLADQRLPNNSYLKNLIESVRNEARGR